MKLKSIRLYIVIILVLLISISLISTFSRYTSISTVTKQNSSDTEYYVEDELWGLDTRCFYQDHTGFLWFGTNDGLFKYDGYKARVFKPDPQNPNSFQGRKINCLYEDTSGNMWIGTLSSGLHIYNAKKRKFSQSMHQEKNPESLSGNNIIGIWKDSKENIWVASREGKIDKVIQTGLENKKGGDSLRFERYSHQDATVDFLSYTVSKSQKDIAWIGSTDGVLKFDMNNPGTPQKGGNYKRYRVNTSGDESAEAVEENAITSVYLEVDGQQEVLWIATKGGIKKVLIKGDKVQVKDYGFPLLDGKKDKSQVQAIFQASYENQDEIWIGTFKGVFLLNKKSGIMKTYAFQIKDAQKKNDYFEVHNFYEDESGVVWVGTSIGAKKVDQYEKRFKYLQADENQLNTLSGNNIMAIRKDEKEGVWVATYSNGLSRLSFGKNKELPNIINTYRLPETANIGSLCTDTSGYLWIGTRGEGVYKVNLRTTYSKNSILTNTIQYKRDWQVQDSTVIGNNYVAELYRDRNNVVWIGTFGEGVSRYNAKDDNFYRYEKTHGVSQDLKAYPTVKMYQDSKGFMWFGTRGGGLYRFIPAKDPKKIGKEKFTFYHANIGDSTSLLDDFVTDIYEDSENRLWIGTEAGLCQFNYEKQTFRAFGKKQGFPVEIVQGIVEDSENNLWLSSKEGVVKMDLDALKDKNKERLLFRKFEAKGAQQNNVFNNNAFCTLKNGTILFGGINGIASFNPQSIKINPFRPRTVFTSFQINHESIPINNDREGDIILPARMTRNGVLSLNYRDKTLGFEFTALHFAEPDKNLFAYKMEGFDEDWIYTNSSRRFVNYTNLPAGSYTFRVKSANNDGLWGKKEIVLQIRMYPAWWNTWWFRIVGSLLIVILIFTFFRVRLLLVQQQKEKLERVVDERTRELQDKNDEVTQQAEELQQQAEELIAQRDFIELQNIELQNANEKMQEDELRLKKILEELKIRDVEISKKNQDLLSKDKRIRQSIQAALAIQQAILPYDDKMKTLLHEYFVMYHPRDIVSGDFYWLNEINGKSILIVADCTGHGIPGAFMTLIGNTLLDKITRVWGIMDPAMILTRLHEEVRRVLKQEYTGNNYGMDMVVMVMENESEAKTKITFAGAKNSLYYINPVVSSEVIEMKGSRRAIGGEQNEEIPFENKEIILTKDTLIYVGSDGFVDQNNVDRRKIGTKRFIKMVEKYSTLKIEEQHQQFERELKEHMQGTTQRDDILLMGFKI